MTKFENRFFKTLKEATEEERAFDAELDNDTDAEDFDTDLEVDEVTAGEDPVVQAAKAQSAAAEQMRGELTSWITEMDTFLSFLNGESNSIQTALAQSESDTIFDRMKQSEQRKIARVATELASLAESFRGYLAQTENPSFRHV
tara:strand:- start:11738 stop:12169 length:432 start_codon:yes stop_codon:yes gene_type:complete